MNLATKYVQASRGTSPVHRYVSDHGQPVGKHEIKRVTVAGYSIALSDNVAASERAIVADAIQATEPSEKACFSNSLRMWEYDDRFEYTEGFAVTNDLDVGGVEHAWCMLDGEKLVDVTAAFDYYHGVTIEDSDVLERYASSDVSNKGIIGNHTNRYEFLRQRGYVD